MDISEIKSYLEENKDNQEVKDFLGGLSKEPDFNELLKDEKFSKALESFKDSAISKAVEAYKEKGFKTAVESEVEKRLKARETKTPEQIKFEELESKLLQMERTAQDKELAALKSDNKVKAINALKEKNLPSEMLDFLVSEDSEKTTTNVELFSSMMENYTQSIKKSYLENNNTFVPSDDSNTDSNEPGENASKEEWKVYLNSKKNKQ